MLSIVFKAFRKVYYNLKFKWIYKIYAKILFTLNGVNFENGIIAHGFIKIIVTRRGYIKIGKNFSFNSGDNHNLIGRQQKTIFWVDGKLKIGQNVGMSSTAIICNYDIEIENNVTIGGGTCIYDSDFHSLNPEIRKDKVLDKKLAKKAKVLIKNNAFIGAHTTILKGVTIGNNSIIGACSVVSKNIPDNQIWAGNPCQFIRNIE